MMIQIFYASTRSTSTSEKNSSEFSQWSPAFFDLVFEFWLLFQRLFEKEREREPDGHSFNLFFTSIYSNIFHGFAYHSNCSLT